MATKALDYDITDPLLQELRSDMKKSNTTHDYRAAILDLTAETLSMHEYFEVNDVDADELGQGFREDELVAIMAGFDAVLNDLKEKQEMTRFEHLKMAVFGR